MTRGKSPWFVVAITVAFLAGCAGQESSDNAGDPNALNTGGQESTEEHSPTTVVTTPTAGALPAVAILPVEVPPMPPADPGPQPTVEYNCPAQASWFSDYATELGLGVEGKTIAHSGIVVTQENITSVNFSYCGVTMEKRDLAGRLLWRKSHRYSFNAYGTSLNSPGESAGGLFSMVRVPGGGYAAVSTLILYLPGQQVSSFQAQTLVLFRFNENGDLLWKKDFTDAAYMVSSHMSLPIVADRDGAVYLGVNGYTGSDFTDRSYPVFSVLKFSSGGTLQWQFRNTNYYQCPGQYANSIPGGWVAGLSLDKRQNIVAVGSVSTNERAATEGAGLDIFFARLNPAGKLLQQKRYVEKGKSQFVRGASLTSKGEFWIIGNSNFASGTGSSFPDYFLMKFDESFVAKNIVDRLPAQLQTQQITTYANEVLIGPNDVIYVLGGEMIPRSTAPQGINWGRTAHYVLSATGSTLLNFGFDSSPSVANGYMVRLSPYSMAPDGTVYFGGLRARDANIPRGESGPTFTTYLKRLE